jgi:hypothetical protein
MTGLQLHLMTAAISLFLVAVMEDARGFQDVFGIIGLQGECRELLNILRLIMI